MFAVPEVDDDIDSSTPIEPKQSTTLPEATNKSLSSSSPPLPSVENVEKNLNKMSVPPPSVPPPSAPVTAKQHRSRRSLFHRNTIHICDQIVDRV
ncbi:unnamed protein product [Adineta steineri]|nr:unnamed protein product [Adineta steineri]CAF0730576.1 unnamed protein product [Adineta steineri]CAF0759370.1 unnamed protein product [Adineta steineri]CAF1502139.1 unnamed protein product [Adineta steineri]CAF1644766.1 unnamed protein product [Adineta steineri]